MGHNPRGAALHTLLGVLLGGEMEGVHEAFVLPEDPDVLVEGAVRPEEVGARGHHARVPQEANAGAVPAGRGGTGGVKEARHGRGICVDTSVSYSYYL